MSGTRAKFKYLSARRASCSWLRDFVKDGELFSSTTLDEHGEDCLIVFKNGTSTGVTLGRASGIESFVREYKDNYNGIHSTSMKIAVYSYSHKDGAFSAPGDSGFVTVLVKLTVALLACSLAVLARTTLDA